MSRHLLPLLVLLAPAFAARAEDDWGPRTARVSVVEGALLASSPFEEGEWEPTENEVLRAGDELRAGELTFAEVELPRDAFLRIAPEGEASLSGLSAEGVEIALIRGSIAASRARDGGPVDVETIAGRVVLAQRAHVRIGADASGRLLVRAHAGEAELRSAGRSWALREGDELSWDAGTVSRGESGEDAFDRWTIEREERVRGISRGEHLDGGYTGWRDLHGSGRWDFVDGRWGWCPSGMDSSWRPYSDGWWAWREPFGWTWVSAHRWGYVTSHHGRWHSSGTRGWCWYPERTWGPAWVSWAVHGRHVGWAPCDFRGRPVSRDARTHYDHRSWSHCDAQDLRDGGRGRGGDRPDSRDARGPRRTTVMHLGQDEMARLRPVPVQDVRTEIAPRDAVVAAERGRVRGVRGSTLLDRATREDVTRARVLDRPAAPEAAARPPGAQPSRLRGVLIPSDTAITPTRAEAPPSRVDAPPARERRRMPLPRFEPAPAPVPAPAVVPATPPPTVVWPPSRRAVPVPAPAPRALPQPVPVPRAVPARPVAPAQPATPAPAPRVQPRRATPPPPVVPPPPQPKQQHEEKRRKSKDG